MRAGVERHGAQATLRIPMDLGLEGRVALVTGASQRDRLRDRRRRWRPRAPRWRSARARRSASRPPPSEIGARAYVHDSADLDAAPGLVDAVEADLGPLAVLVTNTGGPPGGDPLEFTREQWEDAYRELVLGPMALIERALPGMRERGFGRILNVSSSAAREPIPALMLSSAHRSGAARHLQAARRAGWPRTASRSTRSCPAASPPTAWCSVYGSMEAAEEAARDEVPAARLGTVEEIARGRRLPVLGSRPATSPAQALPWTAG